MMQQSAVGVVTCNSATYIQEWIAFQYLTGFDKIIVCLDECDDDTAVKIQRLPEEVLERVDVFENSPHTTSVGFQHRGYQHIFDRYEGKVEWLAMFDDDEYLYDSQKQTINKMLSEISGDVSQIALPWIKFTHSQQVLSAPPDVTRLRHFTHKEHHFQIECKVIVRLDHIITNGFPGDWYRCHSAEVYGKTVTFDGKECELLGANKCQMIPEHYDTCLAHYVHGAMEDFVIKYRKWKRERERLNLQVGFGFDSIAKNESDTKDNRMEIYADELKEILLRCKQ
jgi:hypothetical protein